MSARLAGKSAPEREKAMEPGNTLQGNKASPTAAAYSVGEEIANAITHGLGVLLSISGLTLLIVYSSIYGNAWHVASSIVYGVALILLYLASTLYHSIPFPRVKHVLRIIDHSSIYLLIAGTYTPFTLVTLRDAGGFWLFGIIWGIALAGIAVEAFWLHRPKWITAFGYVVMGWLIIVKVEPLLANLSPPGLWLLIGGGIAYTSGTIFYVMKKVPYMHAVWHVFCLAGSVLHFLAVVLYVLPSGS
jgi:hemolysin III